MRALALALTLLLPTQATWACAWTQARGHGQTISEFAYGGASRLFGDREKISFEKIFAKVNCEYGLTSTITLFVAPQYASAQSDGSDYRERNFALEAGGRFRLWARGGIFSLQASVTSAGAFAAPTAQSGTNGMRGEVRLLYGTSFKLFGADGFADFESAWRRIGSARPDEAVLDATAGLWLTPRNMAMIQSFNIVSSGHGKAPYASYRMHKLEASAVRKLTGHWSVQFGGFFTPAGDGIVAERGLKLAVWLEY